MPWARPATAPSPSPAAPTTACPGRLRLGTASGLATLLGDPAVRAWVTGGGNRHLSVPRGLLPVVAERLDLGSRGGEWDWLWTRHAPPVVPGEEHVVLLDPSVRDEAEAFLTAHSPRTHGQPFAREGQLWVGVRDPGTGALVAVLGAVSRARPVPQPSLASPWPRRGAVSGWGAAVTAHLTRLAVDATGACALGMFADNDVARRLYERLGYTTGMEWTSRWFGV